MAKRNPLGLILIQEELKIIARTGEVLKDPVKLVSLLISDQSGRAHSGITGTLLFHNEQNFGVHIFK